MNLETHCVICGIEAINLHVFLDSLHFHAIRELRENLFIGSKHIISVMDARSVFVVPQGCGVRHTVKVQYLVRISWPIYNNAIIFIKINKLALKLRHSN